MANLPECPTCQASLPGPAPRCPACGHALDEGDDRPWDRPGQVRRDAVPHRGNLLFNLGILSAICGVGSLCSFVSSLIGLPLGVGVWLVARRDLERMHLGYMDPRGEDETRYALKYGLAAIVSSGLAWLLWGLLFSLMLLGK